MTKVEALERTLTFLQNQWHWDPEQLQTFLGGEERDIEEARQVLEVLHEITETEKRLRCG
jgi:hypothetical protein